MAMKIQINIGRGPSKWLMFPSVAAVRNFCRITLTFGQTHGAVNVFYFNK